MAKTRDFAKVIRKQLAADPELRADVEKYRLNFAVASLILEERTKAGLTQKELAALVGTHQSVIARLEDAEYSGHSLSMLWKIADSLGAELKVEFVRPVQNYSLIVCINADELVEWKWGGTGPVLSTESAVQLEAVA